MSRTRVFFFVVGPTPASEAEFQFASNMQGILDRIRNIDAITGFISAMPVFFLLPGHEKHPLWAEIQTCLAAFPHYKSIEIPMEYSGMRY